MNKMKLSAIVLGIAAAGAFAQTAPAAAPAAAPKAEAQAVQADSVKAVEAQKADSVKAAEEAKKAEEEKAAAEAKKAEEEKAAAEAKKAEEEKAAAEAKKAEEEKAAAAPAENTNPGEVADAASSALSTLTSSLTEGTSAANMQIKVSGEVELDAHTNDVTEDGDLEHEFGTTADVDVEIQFNDKWSANFEFEADGSTDTPSAIYNGGYIQYKPADVFAIKIGDMTYSEGAFQSYYGYDDPAYNAAGMKETTIRGLEIDLAGLELGFGFSDQDYSSYDIHAAYEFNYAGQHLRPFVNYMSYQEEEHNELHAGVDAALTIGGFTFRAVYGFHMDYLIDSDDDDDASTVEFDPVTGDANFGGNFDKNGKFHTYDMTSIAHTFLVEPSFEVSIFEIKTAAFFALVYGNDVDNIEDMDINDARQAGYDGEIPEWMFIYAEPAVKIAGFMKLGIPLEYHANSLDTDADVSTFDLGARVYIDPVENLNFTTFAMFDIGIGDDADDFGLRFGVEAVYDF